MRKRGRRRAEPAPDAPIDTFLAVVEIWKPDASGQYLTLAAGHYGKAPAFGEAAKRERFAMGQGLPGRVWQTGCPILLDGLVGTGFVRSLAAAEAGLGAALAIPYRRRNKVEAVVMFLMSVEHDLSGVVEIWRPTPDNQQLTLESGYYSSLTHFAEISRDVRFNRGEGLPGKVWHLGRPHLAPDVRKWSSFVRRIPAEAESITTGVGIPMFENGELESVVTMFGTKDVPLARGVDVLLTSSRDHQVARIPAGPTIARRWRRPVLRLPVHGPRELAGLISITL